MSFDELLDQAIDLLRKRGRLTYRSLRRQFELDDDLLADLSFELIEGQRLAIDEGGSVLVWVGDGPPAPTVVTPPVQAAYTPKHLVEEVFQGRTASEGEIKQVTVLFCDVVGSTEMAGRIGAEAMHGLLNAFFALSLGVIHEYEGTINSFLGDGFMALFGAPVSFEDHPARAVRAAVALREKLVQQGRAFAIEFGVELRVRFGLNTGKVVVGGIGDDLRRDYTAVGDTSNIASRLEQMAEPEEILISESVAVHVRRDADLEALPPRLVKGKTTPMVAYRVLAVRRPRGSELGDGRSLSPFVGRRVELARMLEIAERLQEGHGHIIALRGGAGMGKSRLAREFHAYLDSAGIAFFQGRCVSFEHKTPYRPLLEVVREAAGIGDGDPPETKERKVMVYLQSRSLPSEEWAPYLLRLFGSAKHAEALASLTAEAVRARTDRMFHELMEQASRLRPLVVLIEDLHWIDTASEACIAGMVDVAQTLPVLFLFTYRPGYEPAWLDRTNVTHLDLQRLSPEAGRMLVDAAVGETLTKERLVSAIVERAEGVPFYMEELTRALLGAEGRNLIEEIPSTIEGVITSRIDTLSEPTKRLLHTAAVLGRRFSAQLLREVWAEPGPMAPLLEELLDRSFLRREEQAVEPAYVFVHSLTQDVAYGTILAKRRRSIHLAAGDALERIHAGSLDDVLDRLGHHFSQAGEGKKAVLYLRAFAAKAAASYSHDEAVRALEKALEHAAGEEGDTGDATTLEICDELCQSLYFLGRFEDTIQLLEGCHPRLEAWGDQRSIGIHHFWMGHTCSYLGRMPEAIDHAHRSIEHAQACGDKLTEGRAAYVLERASFWSGRFPLAIRYAEQAINSLVQAGDRWWEGQSRWMIGWSHGAMGEFEPALAAVNRAGEVGEAIKDPRLPCYAAWTSAVILAMRGDRQEAIAAGRRGLERSTDRLNTGVALGFTGFAYLQAGEIDAAIPMLSQGAESMEEMGFRPLQGWFTIWWGESLLQKGEPDRAEELVCRGMEVCQGVRNLWGVGMAQRVLGRIALERGDLEAASQRLEEAEGTLTPLEARYWIARVEFDRAELGMRSGRRDDAARALERARSIFSTLGSDHWLEQTETSTRALSPLPGSTA